MKSPFLGLRTVIYRVSDTEKAKAWYTEVFGKPPYFDEPFYIGFNIGGFELGIQQSDESATDKSENVEAYWGVENIESEYQRLLDLGATEKMKPTNVGGELMVAMVKDPWGNVVGLIYNPYFKMGE